MMSLRINNCKHHHHHHQVKDLTIKMEQKMRRSERCGIFKWKDRLSYGIKYVAWWLYCSWWGRRKNLLVLSKPFCPLRVHQRSLYLNVPENHR
jgi:hypothetical protein